MRPFPLKILLCALAVSSLWAGEPIGSPGPPYNPLPNGKAPFRMIYSNDTTNIFTCPSPWRPRPDIPFSAKMIEETVKEAAVKGMDAQMIQPGTGWVAWWKSKKLPFTRQLDWFKKEYGKETYVGDFVDYMVNRNGDVVGDFLEACRKYNQACFVSYRLNDLHHLREGLDGNPGGNRAIYLSKFYLKNDEYRLGKGLGVVDIAHNWMIPEVVQEKFEFIDEIARTYDLDGIELDFLRSPNFFQTERHTKTPPTMAQRVQVMTQFISKVRKSIDESAKDGRRRWLCVRVPAEQADWIKVGLDPKAWRAAGVSSIGEITRSVPSTVVTSMPRPG